jgi:hypothetical protein
VIAQTRLTLHAKLLNKIQARKGVRRFAQIRQMMTPVTVTTEDATYIISAPGRTQKIFSFGACVLIGSALAYASPGLVAWKLGLVPMLALGFLAGVSTLWSP